MLDRTWSHKYSRASPAMKRGPAESSQVIKSESKKVKKEIGGPLSRSSSQLLESTPDFTATLRGGNASTRLQVVFNSPVSHLQALTHIAKDLAMFQDKDALHHLVNFLMELVRSESDSQCVVRINLRLNSRTVYEPEIAFQVSLRASCRFSTYSALVGRKRMLASPFSHKKISDFHQSNQAAALGALLDITMVSVASIKINQTSEPEK